MTLSHWKNRSRHWRENSAGTAGVEFAFVVPVFLALTMAVFELGRIAYAKAEFEYAVFYATRYGMVARSANTDQIKESLGDNLILLDPAKLSTVTVSEVVNADKSRTATLTAAYQFEFLLPITDQKSVALSKSVSFLRVP
jgi:Flp pilus assembly protein TadG